MLAHAVAANRYCAVLHHGLPKECGGIAPRRVAAYLRNTLVANDLRYLGVGAPLLGAQHILNLRIAEVGREVEAPVGELDEHGLGLRVASQQVGVAQAGVRL
nr:hypothetical protein [Tanacetum cinerariifolium]